MNRTLLVAVAVVTPLVAACSGYRLARPTALPIDGRGGPPPGLAQVCVVRPHWIAAAVTLPVHDNGTLVGATRGPSYFCYFAEPGVHVIASEDAESGDLVGAQTVSVELAEGARYFLHQRVHPFGHRIEWVDPLMGEQMMDRAGYRVIARAPDGEQAPAQPPIAPAWRAQRMDTHTTASYW
jgi:hypothetical protein